MGGTDATSTNSPWKPAEGYYKDLYASAKTAFDKTQATPYTGQVYQAPNQTQIDANNQVKTAAGSMGTGVDEMRQLALSQLRGDWLNPDSNPYIKQIAQAAINPLQDQFNINKNAVGDKAIMQGAYGGSRQDLQENQLVDQFTKSAGDITAGIYGQNYANERGIQQNSGQLLDQANLLGLAGPTALASAGAQEQGWGQSAIDAELKKWQMNQNQNWAGMSELANILGSGGFGTTTKTDASNPLLGILQGLMGGATTGAGLATGIGGVAAGAGLGAFAPWMLPFAALGGLAGAL